MKTIQKFVPKFTVNKYLMGRHLKCAKCGYTYVGRTRKSKAKKYQYYYCKGKEKTPISLCDMPTFRAEDVNEVVWSWLSDLLQSPENIYQGLLKMQEETKRSNSAIFDRVTFIESQLEKAEAQLARLLDLYLNGNFPINVLNQRKNGLKKSVTELKREQAELNNYTDRVILSEEGIEEIEAFCESVRSGLDDATFEVKQKLIDLLDVHGKLAIENEEKVVYISCKLLNKPQRLSPIQTSLSSNTGEIVTQTRAFPRTVQFQ